MCSKKYLQNAVKIFILKENLVTVSEHHMYLFSNFNKKECFECFLKKGIIKYIHFIYKI